MDFFSKDSSSAILAKENAQWIAFAPMIFQATRALRNLGILTVIYDAGENGITIDGVFQKLSIPYYGVRVLMEAGLGIGLLVVNDGHFTLTKSAYFILHDQNTIVNMDFSNDVCYEGMFSLEQSIINQKPEGLKKIGKQKTVYESLSQLDPHVQKSWFAFDHFYSDDSFPEALEHVYKDKPKTLLDIGGNTGEWSIASVGYDKNVMVTIMDLPGQIVMAKKNIAAKGLQNRVNFYPTNVLDESLPFPKGFDAIWMSQFLDCFSDEQIISVLKRCRESLNEDGTVFIMELFWDIQKFEGAAFCLQMTSLYFTAIANGNSQMYSSKVFLDFLEKAGLKIIETIAIGSYHSLLKCKKM